MKQLASIAFFLLPAVTFAYSRAFDTGASTNEIGNGWTLRCERSFSALPQHRIITDENKEFYEGLRKWFAKAHGAPDYPLPPPMDAEVEEITLSADRGDMSFRIAVITNVVHAPLPGLNAWFVEKFMIDDAAANAAGDICLVFHAAKKTVIEAYSNNGNGYSLSVHEEFPDGPDEREWTVRAVISDGDAFVVRIATPKGPDREWTVREWGVREWIVGNGSMMPSPAVDANLAETAFSNTTPDEVRALMHKKDLQLR